MTKFRLKFRIFHLENPQVWEKFEAYAMELIKNDITRHSSRGILYVIRYHTLVGIDGTKKIHHLNNNYSPDYARMFAERYPQHKDFFETRKLKSKK